MKDRLMARLVDFETTPDPVAGADLGAAAAGGAVTPPDPATASPPVEQPAAWQGPSQEEWRQTQDYLQQTAPFMQELQSLLYGEPTPEAAQAQQQGQFDLSTTQGQQQYLDSRVEQMLSERLSPFEPLLGTIAEREGEQMARSELDRLATEGGDFNRDLALVAAQLNVNNMAPAEALAQAAQWARTLQSQIGESAVEAYKQSLTAAATAPTDFGAPGAATDVPTVATGRNRYEETMARVLSGQNPTMPTG